MKFAHLADCHIGGWREPVLRELNNRAFSEAVARCLAEKVDFVLIAGDLFNTSLPALDSLRSAVAGLRELKEAGIPVYAVPGSHDYSPSGRTIVDVLESAGLLVNVVNEEANFVVDKKTGAKLIGLPGWKGGLDQSLFSSIDKSALEAEKGFKIF
ncbi:MAG: DNA repair exonuclease, partial [Candidatus Woesearchaeota archaeon]